MVKSKLKGAPMSRKCRPLEWEECENGCWEVTSHKPNDEGYVRLILNKETISAHRLIYQECFGAIPDGLIVRHKCDNPKCINPEHIEVGTHMDNTMDKMSRERQWKPTGKKNPKAKLTEVDVEFIRSGEGKLVDKALKLGITYKHASDIKCGKYWR